MCTCYMHDVFMKYLHDIYIHSEPALLYMYACIYLHDISARLHDISQWASLSVDPPDCDHVIGHDTHTGRALELADTMPDAVTYERMTHKTAYQLPRSIPRGTLRGSAALSS